MEPEEGQLRASDPATPLKSLLGAQAGSKSVPWYAPLPALRPVDHVMLAYLVVELALVLLARDRNPSWPVHAGLHAVMITAVVALASTAGRWSPPRFLRDWFPALLIPLIFLQLGTLVPAVHPRHYDDLLMAWDRALFGGNPGAWFDGLASPLFTEVLRACWLSYFLLPFAIAIPLWCRTDRRAFEEFVLALVLGWLLSFAGYYMLPAMGPGWFPEQVPQPAVLSLPGPTDAVAQFLFRIEGPIPDVFPSGHTIVALIVLWQAKRHGLRGWPAVAVLVAGLLCGTVYLRYHYGVDIVAGAAVVGLVMAIAPRWAAAWRAS